MEESATFNDTPDELLTFTLTRNKREISIFADGKRASSHTRLTSDSYLKRFRVNFVALSTDIK